MSAENQFDRELLARIADAAPLAADLATPAPTQPTRHWLHRRFEDLPIAHKLRLVFGSFIATMVVLAAAIAITLIPLRDAWQQAKDVAEAGRTTSDLRGDAGEMRYNVVRFIFSGEKSALEKAHLANTRIEAALHRLDHEYTSLVPEAEPAIISLQGELENYNASFARLQGQLRSGASTAQNRPVALQLAKSGDAIYNQTRALETTFDRNAQRIETRAYRNFRIAGWSLAAAALAAALLLFLIMNAVSTRFGDRVREISQRMRDLANGETEFELAGAQRRDEIGEMVRSIDTFKRAGNRLRRLASERTVLNTREAERQAERERERQQLADRFERGVGDIVSSVASASSQLRTTSEAMARTAQQSARETDAVQRASTDASQGALSAASASDEFARSIREISTQAAASAQLAREASLTAEEADHRISALTDAAANIGAIVELIHAIARRTNLLAINASIEASRGGEAGRGFAVVASEVKELAGRTARATEEVSEQIRAMQETTGNSVDALRAVSGHIRQLEVTAISIAAAVDQQSIAGQRLASNIEMTARHSDEVAERIVAVRQDARSTGTAAAQVLNSASDLEVQANALHDQMAQFLTQIRTG